MRPPVRIRRRAPAGGSLSGYPHDALHQEIAFLAYYLHWDYATLINMEHRERRRWCAETSAINRKAGGDMPVGATSLEDMV
jgi:hypothetical protein